MKTKISRFVWTIILCILIFLYFYRNLQIGVMWSFSDLLPFNTYRSLDLFLGTWDFNLLGYPFVTSAIPIIPLFLGAIIRNDTIAQNIYYLSFLPLSFMTMYILSRRFISCDIERYTTCFLYVLNPITIGEFSNGSAWMGVYALSPIIVLFVIKFLEHKNVNIFCGITITVLFGLVTSNIWTTFWILIFPIFVIILIKSMKELIHKNYRFLIRTIFLFIFILLGLSLLLPSIDYLFFAKDTAFNQDSVKSYFKDMEHNYDEAIPTNVARMAGNAGSPMHNLGYDKNNWWTAFGFVIPILILFAVLKNRQLFDDVYILSFSIIILFSIIFMFLTHLKWIYWIYNDVPLFFSLRNPKYLMYSFSLATSILFGIGAYRLTIRFKDFKKYTISFLILFSLFIYLYPIWNGYMGLDKRSSGYTVPGYYYSTFDYIKNDGGEYYRVLWLPYTYVVQTRLVNNINHVGIRLGQDISASSSYDNIYDMFLSVKYNRTENIAQNLGFYNIKYIVIDKNFTPDKQTDAYVPAIPNDIEIYSQSQTPFVRGPPIKFIKYMDHINGIKKIHEDENVVIYKNDYFRPYVYVLNISDVNIFKIEKDNIIINNNFSNSTNHWKMWNLEFGGKISIINDTFTYINIINPDNMNPVTVTQEFRAIQGNKYNFSLMIRSQSANGTHAKIAWYDNVTNLIEINAIRHDVVRRSSEIDNNWKRYEDIFIAPKGTIIGIVYLVTGKGMVDSPASVSFSNITVLEKSPNDPIMKNVDQFEIISVENATKDRGTIQFRVKTNESSILIFSESYNFGWNAYIGNTSLEHFKILNWANGFKIPGKMDDVVTIEYKPQKNRYAILAIWVIIWVSIMTTLVILIYRHRKHTHKG